MENIVHEEEFKIIQPFLRWVGGKRWFVKHIDDFLPLKFNNYHEPFLGGASVFLYLKNNGKIKHNAFLSDLIQRSTRSGRTLLYEARWTGNDQIFPQIAVMST